MNLVTLSQEFSDAEAQKERVRLKAADFHPSVVDKLRTSIGDAFAGSILFQVPESEAADAREFLKPSAA